MSEITIQIKTEDGLTISKTIFPAILRRYSSPSGKDWHGAFVIGELDESSREDIGENFVSVYLDENDLDKLQREGVSEEDE